MMHPTFFHWHARAELKPDVAVLESRWNAAAKFGEKISSNDICSLVKLVLFSGAEPEFAKRFSSALVKSEPTFPPSNNGELLRVMATATVYHQLETPSKIANAFALGLQAANFPSSRGEPVCQEIMDRAAEYRTNESERVRPKIYAGSLGKAEKQAETAYIALKKAGEANSPQETSKAAEALGRGILTALKESHQQLGDVISRLAEESQFLWWLIGRRSPALEVQRDDLAPEIYALPAAAEAVKRVTVLPPALCVESLLDEVLSQCKKKSPQSISLHDLINMNTDWVLRTGNPVSADSLTPISSLFVTRMQATKIDMDSIKKLGLPVKTKVTPPEAARQFFREQIFCRALKELN